MAASALHLRRSVGTGEPLHWAGVALDQSGVIDPSKLRLDLSTLESLPEQRFLMGGFLRRPGRRRSGGSIQTARGPRSPRMGAGHSWFCTSRNSAMTIPGSSPAWKRTALELGPRTPGSPRSGSWRTAERRWSSSARPDRPRAAARRRRSWSSSTNRREPSVADSPERRAGAELTAHQLVTCGTPVVEIRVQVP